jgi:hypothetical protein
MRILLICIPLVLVTICSDAQQLIYKINNKTLSCSIQSIAEDGIAYIDSNNFVQFISRKDIKSISTYVLDKKFYFENFSLKRPYIVSDLYLTNVLSFKKGYSFENNRFLTMRVKILEEDGDTVLFLRLTKNNIYRIDKVALESLEAIGIDLTVRQRTDMYSKINEDVVFSRDTAAIGTILGWSKDGVNFVPSANDSLSVFIPNEEIAFIRSSGGNILYPGDDIVPTKVRKAYPRVSLAVGLKVAGFFDYSGIDNGDRNTTFLNGSKNSLQNLHGFSFGTQIDFTKHIDVQLRYNRRWSDNIIFNGSDYATSWYTEYRLKLNQYEVGVGYFLHGFRIGAGMTISETKSLFLWQQSTYKSRRYGSAATNREEGTIVSRPSLGYSFVASYKIRLGKNMMLEPEIKWTTFSIDFDRLMDVRRTSYLDQGVQPVDPIGGYSEFKSSYGSGQTKWNVLFLNIICRRNLFKM